MNIVVQHGGKPVDYFSDIVVVISVVSPVS